MYRIGSRWTQITSLLVVSFLAAGAIAQSSSQTTRISSNANKVTITVLQETDLRSVLDSLCREAKATCSGTEMAGAQKVSPMSASGTWSEVISELLEGTHLNYVTGAPSGDTPPQLLIQGVATAISPVSPTQDQASQAVNVESATLQPPASEGPQMASSEGANNSAAAAPLSAAADNTYLPGAAFDMGGGTGVLPFPDANGKPIVLSAEPGRYLPFTDNGKPIPIPAPAQSNVLPFSDNGKPIVLNPEPQEYLPFTDNGKLIPMPKTSR